MKRAMAYIDGFNLYYGLRSRHWQRFYWLNLHLLAQLLTKSDQRLVYTHYYTSIVTSPDDKNRRQNTYIEALRTPPDFDITYGHFLAEPITCKHCGHTYTTYHEKMTDVNIAAQLLVDAFQDRFDLALLISADSDLVGPIRTLRELYPQKRVIVVFPPDRHSSALQAQAHACLHITANLLSRSLFADQVISAAGFPPVRPPQWR